MKKTLKTTIAGFSIFLIGFVTTALSAQALTNDQKTITTAFTSIQKSSAPVWPVENSSINAIESNFGPRIQTSTGKYDWHRGIDIDAKLGTKVFATQTGDLWKVYQYPNNTYPDGGNVVIVRHKFPNTITYAGKTLTYYYTIYMHLNSIESKWITASNANQHPAITKGTLLGTVGHTGEPNIADHLHFELRVGTYCSLEFQLANPASSCSKGFGFDPAMNPLLIFAPVGGPTALTLASIPNASTDGKARVTMPKSQPLLNRIDFTITNISTGAKIKSTTLDFDDRTGFNATSTAALDTQDKTKPYIAPLTFTDASTNYQTDVVIPKAYMGNYGSAGYKRTLITEDIWGNTQSIQW